MVERRYTAVSTLLQPLLKGWEGGSKPLPEDQAELPLCYALAAQAAFKEGNVELARDLMQSAIALCQAEGMVPAEHAYYTSLLQNLGAYQNVLGKEAVRGADLVLQPVAKGNLRPRLPPMSKRTQPIRKSMSLTVAPTPQRTLPALWYG